MPRAASAEEHYLIIFSWATVLVFLMFQEFLDRLEVTEEYCDRRKLFRSGTTVNLTYRSHKLLQQNCAGEKKNHHNKQQ